MRPTRARRQAHQVLTRAGLVPDGFWRGRAIWTGAPVIWFGVAGSRGSGLLNVFGRDRDGTRPVGFGPRAGCMDVS